MELIIYFDKKYLLLTDSKNTNNSLPIIACYSVSDLKKALAMLETTDCSAVCIQKESFEDLLTIVKSAFLYLEAAGGLVKNEQNEILCMKRRGFWDLAKGKLDKGETPEEAAIREVQEETGVKNIVLGNYLCSTWHTYEHPKGKGPVLKQTYWYNMNASINEVLVPETEEGIEELAWFNEQQIQEIVFPNTFPSILDVLEKGE